ncbi:hypothetical protein [Vibrio splendidus]|uniref:hypothetical protein n=1 Tax=Vibrio splendidus TaxID=29497 RepID=UPI0007F963B6|nr:hypothetical protein [Vibrio splendidus]OBT24227.1 hypothetical protein A9262_19655 [Vibrio splendidus]
MKANKLFIFLYLFPVFFINLNFGNDPEIGVPTHILCYTLLIFFGFIIRPNFFIENSKAIIITILVVIGHSLYYIYAFSEYIFNYMYVVVQFYFVFFSVCIVNNSLKHREDIDFFFYIFEFLSKISIVFIILSVIVYKSTGLYFLADSGYGGFRPHAFFSEPSATSFVLSYFTMVNVIRKNFLWVLLSFISLFCVSSLIGILVFIITLFLWVVLKLNPFKRLLIIFSILFFFFLMLNFFMSLDPDSFGTISSDIKRLQHGIEAIITFNQSGYNPRMQTLVEIYEYLERLNGLFLGFGVFSDTFLPFSQIAASASNLPAQIYFNFGLVGLILIYGFMAYVFIFLTGRNRQSLMFISLLATTSSNSAQGFIIYSVLFVMALILVKGRYEDF